ncbi:hypothetical protein ABIB45_002867 [Arthrobacter sp. UYCo732]
MDTVTDDAGAPYPGKCVLLTEIDARFLAQPGRKTQPVENGRGLVGHPRVRCGDAEHACPLNQIRVQAGVHPNQPAAANQVLGT